MIGDSAGYVFYVGTYSFAFNGNVNIIQGNGYADLAVLDDGNVVNNVNIIQGDSIFTPGCLPGLGDEVDIDDTSVDNNISIVQGASEADVGNNVVNIATKSAIFAGGAASITEVGANNGNNTITLGGANDPSGIDFQTDYLDIYTGNGGGHLSRLSTRSAGSVLPSATTLPSMAAATATPTTTSATTSGPPYSPTSTTNSASDNDFALC